VPFFIRQLPLIELPVVIYYEDFESKAKSIACGSDKARPSAQTASAVSPRCSRVGKSAASSSSDSLGVSGTDLLPHRLGLVQHHSQQNTIL
jgi:hypothetical protein